MNKKTILITGYPGWFSCRFIELELGSLKDKYNFVCLVKPGVYIEMDESVKSIVNIRYADITNEKLLYNAIVGVDIVLHTAAVIHPKSIKDYYRINRDGTENLLKASKKAKISRFIYISTNAVCGYNPGKQLVEEDVKCVPRCDYGISKYQAELLVRDYYRNGSFETVILRPAMFYGPPVPKRHVEMWKRLQKGKFIIFGKGDYFRSLTYVDNLAGAVVGVLESDCAVGKEYFIVDDCVYTTKGIVEQIGKSLGVDIILIHLPVFFAKAAFLVDRFLSKLNVYCMTIHLIGESVWNVAYSSRKAKNDFGYKPKIGLVEGYDISVGWCKRRGLLK